MISKFLNMIGQFLCKGKLGILFTILFSKASKVVVSEILNEDNQKKAYEFVKELNKRTDMSNKEKAKMFNEQMLDWSKKLGKKMCESVINCLRELAVNALKAESNS